MKRCLVLCATIYVACGGFVRAAELEVMQACEKKESARMKGTRLSVSEEDFVSKWLGDRGGQLRFLCLPLENLEMYSAIYNIDEVRVTATYGRNRYGLPLAEALKNEFLKGFSLKPQCAQPITSNEDFSLESVVWENYEHVSFSSKFLKEVFVQNTLGLLRPGVTGNGLAWGSPYAPTKPGPSQELMESLISKNQKICWTFVEKNEFYRNLAKMECEKQGAEFFIILKGMGALWGAVVPKKHKIPDQKRSLFDYRIKNHKAELDRKYLLGEH